MMNVAATASERRPKAMSTGWANEPSPAAATTSVTRATPRKAQLVSAPDIRPLTRLGASPYVSGFQVCIGASPIFVPKPTRRNRTAARRLVPQVADDVDRRDHKEHAGQRQHGESERIGGQPAAERRQSGSNPQGRDQCQVYSRHDEEQ